MHAGRGKGKQAGDKLPLLAVQCLDALLRLGRTCEGVAELLQEVSVHADAKLPAMETGIGPWSPAQRLLKGHDTSCKSLTLQRDNVPERMLWSSC